VTVTPLRLPPALSEPDAPLRSPVTPPADDAFGNAVLGALDAASAALERAGGAERAFAGGHGGLQEMVLERAQADVALSLASTTASRVTQALGTILGMQV